MDGLSSLLSSLSAEDIDSLKAAAASLLNDTQNETEPAPEDFAVPKPAPDLPFRPEDMAMITKLGSLLSSSGNKDDYRTNFINALKPLLSEPRRKRADEAMRIMRLLDMLPLLKESGIFKEFF